MLDWCSWPQNQHPSIISKSSDGLSSLFTVVLLGDDSSIHFTWDYSGMKLIVGEQTPVVEYL